MTESYNHHHQQQPSSSSSSIQVAVNNSHHQSSGQIVSTELSTSQQQHKFAPQQFAYHHQQEDAAVAMTNGSNITAAYGYDSPDCGYYEHEPVDHYRSTCAMQHLQQMTQSSSTSADFPAPTFVQHHMSGGQQQQAAHYPPADEHSDSIGKLPSSRNLSLRVFRNYYFSVCVSLDYCSAKKMADYNPFTASFISSPESNSRSSSPLLLEFPPFFVPPLQTTPEQPNTDLLFTYLAYQAAAAAAVVASANPVQTLTQQQQQHVSKSPPTGPGETIYPWMRDAKRTFQQQTTTLVQQHQQSGGHYTSLVLTPSDSHQLMASPLSPQPTPPISLSPGKK